MASKRIAVYALISFVGYVLISCNGTIKEELPLPQKILKGKQMYLGQSFDEIRKERKPSRESWFSKRYVERLYNGYFDAVVYRVIHGTLQSAYFGTDRPRTPEQVDEVVALLTAQYDSAQFTVNVDTANSVTTWEWKLGLPIYITMQAMWKGDVASPDRYNGLWLYIGPPDD